MSKKRTPRVNRWEDSTWCLTWLVRREPSFYFLVFGFRTVAATPQFFEVCALADNVELKSVGEEMPTTKW